jgi:hypothetical protein
MLVSLAFAAAVSPGAAATAVPTGAELTPVAQLSVPHKYRSGLVVGLSLGAGLGGASGYPNNSQDIGNSADYSASGWMTGGMGQVFVLGALSDYLSFGFWYGHTTLRNGDWHASGDGGGFRVEVFPLVDLVPWLHGLGVFANLGVGGGTLTSTNPALPQAQGVQSIGGIGVLQEWSFLGGKWGHFAFGPALEFDAVWSQPFEEHGLVASARLAYYGGP